MATDEDGTVTEMVREMPVQWCLCTVVPVVLAIVQLSNSYFYGLPWLVSGLFALVFGSFAVLSTQYHLAQFRQQTPDFPP